MAPGNSAGSFCHPLRGFVGASGELSQGSACAPPWAKFRCHSVARLLSSGPRAWVGGCAMVTQPPTEVAGMAPGNSAGSFCHPLRGFVGASGELSQGSACAPPWAKFRCHSVARLLSSGPRAWVGGCAMVTQPPTEVAGMAPGNSAGSFCHPLRGFVGASGELSQGSACAPPWAKFRCHSVARLLSSGPRAWVGGCAMVTQPPTEVAGMAPGNSAGSFCHPLRGFVGASGELSQGSACAPPWAKFRCHSVARLLSSGPRAWVGGCAMVTRPSTEAEEDGTGYGNSAGLFCRPLRGFVGAFRRLWRGFACAPPKAEFR